MQQRSRVRYISVAAADVKLMYMQKMLHSPKMVSPFWKEYGTDAVLFSNGYVLDRVLAAADLLKEQGINVTVADINILYGKDPSKILDVMAKTSQIVTVEDHNINGGLGSYISRLATENQPVKVKRIALTDFAESGPAKELADAYGYAPEKIAATVKETLGK